jgi:acetylornithine deacetylase/succinyl-diaminopimelate desuccinylase-like protein
VVEGFLRALARGAPLPQRLALPLLLEPRLAGKLLDVLQKRSPDQAMAFNAMLHNTTSPTMLAAGKKINVIPTSASAHVDGRVLPGQAVAEFLAEVQQVVGDDLTITVLEQHDGPVFPSDTPLYATIRGVLARHDPGATTVPYMIPGFTDSFAYKELGAVCYGFSPVKLGPELNFTRMYHGHDERIPIEGFAWGLRVLFEVVKEFCAAA